MTFQKGNRANPFGRPKNPESEELRKALQAAAKKNKKSFLLHLVERAYKNDSVAIAVAKKILPDLAHQSGESSLKVTVMECIKKDGKKVIFNVGD